MSEETSPLDELFEAISDATDLALHLGVGGTIQHVLGLDEYQIELAYTVLLVDIACVDNDFAPRESYFIKQKLQEHLDVDYNTAIKLVEKATKITQKKNVNLDRFGTYLAQHISKKKRLQLLDDIDKLIAQDKLDHPFETDLRARYAKLLGLAE